MEAELFAAERCRPAQNGRALSCAADNAREIQGITASRNLPDARNRAPVTPVSLHISDVSAQRKVRGVKRGQETILGVLSPFVPAGEPRHPRPWARPFSAARRRHFPPVNTGTPCRRSAAIPFSRWAPAKLFQINVRVHFLRNISDRRRLRHTLPQLIKALRGILLR